MNLIFRSSALLLLAFLQGCGSEDDSNFAPTVSAGDDRTARGGQEVVLTATAEDTNGSIQSYQWSQTGGAAVTLVDADEEAMSFEAPVDSQSQVLEFKVIVTDNENARAADSIQVTVQAGIAAPENFRVRMVGRNAILQWDPVEEADDYLLYYAQESFSGLSDTVNYATLEGAERLLITLSDQPLVQLRNLTDKQRYFFTVTTRFTPSLAVQPVESIPATEISRLVGQTLTASQPLNDTTVIKCLDANAGLVDCAVETLPNQDGDLGRTAQDAADKLIKAGFGLAGFDFTLLDAEGEEMSPGSAAADCLRDNVTGLVWELKKQNLSMRRADNRYSWYEPDATINGGEAGLLNGPDCAGGVCNTFAYLSRLNQQSLCGLTQWRLPSVADLRSIGDIGKACNLDGGGCRYDLSSYYWSSTTRADDATEAWQITLDGRTDVPMSKSKVARLIAVADKVADKVEESE